MNPDFSKYQSLITQFSGQIGKQGFDQKFMASTQKLTKTESFLLKMELNRLSSPCTRAIDLRGLVDGECKFYEYAGQSHFLDDIAIEVFEKNVAIYGSYTFGVYEAVKKTKNNFRVIYEKEQSAKGYQAEKIEQKSVEKKQYPAALYQFDRYFDRCEERMNFAISLQVTFAGQPLEATSLDISVHGCRFRFTDQQNLRSGDIISIKFTGLEQDFQFGKADVFSYQVCNNHQDADTKVMGCRRIDIAENDAFKRFLESYIQGNKRRYKVNLDNTIAALQARNYEQYLLPKLNELAVFLTREAQQLLPRYALTTNNNQSIFQYWQDELGQSTLHQLLNEKRLARLQVKAKQQKSLLVYSFIHQHQGKSFFYSIDDQQVAADDSCFIDFIAFAAKQASFAITELTGLAVTKGSAYTPFTLSNTQKSKNQYINLPPSEEVNACLASLPYMVVVSDLTQENVVAKYQQLSPHKIDTQKLKLFGHKRLKSAVEVDDIGVSYKNQRQELRFIYETEAVVECEGVSWHGKSNDFSISGLKINLDHSAMLKMGDIVYLTFPKLQKITSAFDLKGLPYEIVRINKKKTIINLRVHVKEHQHIGRAFFKLLIDKNRHKLTPDEYAMLTPGLAAALRTTYSQNMRIPALIVQTSGSRYKIEAMACNDQQNPLLQQMKRLSDRQRFYNLYPLLSKLQGNNTLEHSLKSLLTNEEPVSQLIYVQIKLATDKVDEAVKVVAASELDTPELRAFFIKRALKQGQFYCLQLKISRTNEPDIDYLNAELSYISSYAIHRGKQIEQDIWSVVGVIQVFDMTKEALLNNNLFAG